MLRFFVIFLLSQSENFFLNFNWECNDYRLVNHVKICNFFMITRYLNFLVYTDIFFNVFSWEFRGITFPFLIITMTLISKLQTKSRFMTTMMTNRTRNYRLPSVARRWERHNYYNINNNKNVG